MKLPVLCFFAMLLSACGNGGKTHISQSELLLQIQQKHAPLIVDVRSSYEYGAGHIPGALHIPFWQAFTTDRLNGRQPAELLVLYCEHGPRAGIAKWGLSMQGFESIVYLEGHMNAWREAGLPMEAGAIDKPNNGS